MKTIYNGNTSNHSFTHFLFVGFKIRSNIKEGIYMLCETQDLVFGHESPSGSFLE